MFLILLFLLFILSGAETKEQENGRHRNERGIKKKKMKSKNT